MRVCVGHEVHFEVVVGHRAFVSKEVWHTQEVVTLLLKMGSRGDKLWMVKSAPDATCSIWAGSTLLPGLQM